MPIEPFPWLACPLDGEALQHEQNGWRCPHGHSFDQARQGYLHLLPVQHKRSKAPGDSQAMVEARQRFLAGGFYQPLAERLAQACLADSDANTALTVLDAGCGEGYYLRQLADRAPPTQRLALAGLDISKPATLAAARQRKDIRWLVASNAHLPIQSASLDRVLCVFGFPVAAEFARVLKPGGRLIQLDPGPAHLQELRELLYDQISTDAQPKAPQLEGLRLVEEDHLCYHFHLTRTDAIQDLLVMTPHGHRAPAEGKAKAAQMSELELTAEVFVRVYELLPD